MKYKILLSALSMSALTLSACGDDSSSGPDAQVNPVDAAVTDAPTADASTSDGAVGDGSVGDAATSSDGGGDDAGGPDAASSNASAQIMTIRGTADGTGLSLPVTGAYVTYLKPALGGDPAGFTIQAEQTGPAVFVTVDPATLSPVPAVGDTVSFTATEISTYGSLRQVAAITSFTRDAQGFDVSTLAQNVSAATDLVSALASYESELIDVTGTITGTFGGAGSQFTQAQIDTAGITGDTGLRLRLPSSLQSDLDVVQGCGFTLDNTPVGRFDAAVQLAAFVAADIALTNCPAPTVVNAVATDLTHVNVTFDRHINPASVLGDGSQFAIDNGLTVSAATVSGKVVTLTTSTQTGNASYTVTVAATVLDALGAGVSTPNTANFSGFIIPAVVRINEVNANITGGCDVIELRVISSGTMAGYTLKERDTTTLLTFPAGFMVTKNDLIVVHTNSNNASCNPNGATQETASITEQAVANFGGNYDTAFDFWSTDTGLTATDNVLTLYDNTLSILDAVLVADDPTGAAAAGSETQAAAAAAAMQWQMVGGGIPAAGFVDDDFCAHAALDLNATGTSVAGESIQRNDDADNNDKDDWTQAASSFALINAGQTSL